MEDKKYVKALDIKEMEHIEPGHTIKLYGEETTVQAFYAAYNEGLGRWETIILTDGRGDPFERSLDVIEVLPDQPWNHPLPPGATILPTNEQVSAWFEENIDKECSASSAIYKFRQWLKSLPAEPKRGPVWVKASDRLPGYEIPVKWRDGNDHAHATNGKIPLIHMAKPFLTGWEWYDESAPSGERENDAVAFNIYCTDSYYYENGYWWHKENHDPYSVDQLYDIFKQQKENNENS